MYRRGIRGVLLSLCLAFCLSGVLISNLSSCGTSRSLVPTKLEVTRSSPLRSLPALHTTITDVSAVRHLYQAAYKLPGPPEGKRNCLNDTGIVYHLKFVQDAQNSETMDMQVSGCLILTTVQG